MTYPAPVLRLVMSGPYFGTEQWSMGLNFQSNFPTDPTGPDTVPAAVRTAVEAFITSGQVSNAVQLGTIKLNLVGTNGKYADPSNTVRHDYTGALPVGTGARTHAPQVSLVATLNTANSRGLAHQGRIFIPGPPATIDAAGLITVVAAEAARTAVLTLINSLNTALPGWRAAIASDVREGAINPITSVKVGRVLDTVRSRRASLVEAYTANSAAVTA